MSFGTKPNQIPLSGMLGNLAFRDAESLPDPSGYATKDGVETLTNKTLTNPVINGADFSGQQLIEAMLRACGLTMVDLGDSGTNPVTLDYSAGSVQRVRATGAFTLSTDHWPAAGNLGTILLKLVDGGSQIITFPTIQWEKPDGTYTTSFATYLAANTGRTSLKTSGVDFILLWSDDGGTTIYGKLA